MHNKLSNYPTKLHWTCNVLPIIIWCSTGPVVNISFVPISACRNKRWRWRHNSCAPGSCDLTMPSLNMLPLKAMMKWAFHYGDVKMGTMASQITSLALVYSTVYSGTDQRKHQSSASLAFVRGIHRGPVNSPHKWLVTRKMFPFDDVIMRCFSSDLCLLIASTDMQ